MKADITVAYVISFPAGESEHVTELWPVGDVLKQMFEGSTFPYPIMSYLRRDMRTATTAAIIWP